MNFQIDLQTANELIQLLSLSNSLNLVLPTEDENGSPIKIEAYTEKVARFHSALKLYSDEMSNQSELAKRYLGAKKGDRHLEASTPSVYANILSAEL